MAVYCTSENTAHECNIQPYSTLSTMEQCVYYISEIRYPSAILTHKAFLFIIRDSTFHHHFDFDCINFYIIRPLPECIQSHIN